MVQMLLRHRQAVNCIAGLSAVAVIGRTALQGVEEPFFWMSEVGVLLYDAGLAFLTAWFFQLLVVVLPAGAQQRRLNLIASRSIDHLIRVGYELADVLHMQLGKAAGAFPVSHEDIAIACARTTTQEWAPGWDASWSTVIRSLVGDAARFRRALKPHYSRLPDELLEVLEREEIAMAYLARSERAARQYERENMTPFVKPIQQWLDVVEELLNLRNSSIAPEQPAPNPSAERPWLRSPLVE